MQKARVYVAVDEAWEETAAILADKDALAAIETGMAELARGETVTWEELRQELAELRASELSSETDRTFHSLGLGHGGGAPGSDRAADLLAKMTVWLNRIQECSRGVARR